MPGGHDDSKDESIDIIEKVNMDRCSSNLDPLDRSFKGLLIPSNPVEDAHVVGNNSLGVVKGVNTKNICMRRRAGSRGTVLQRFGKTGHGNDKRADHVSIRGLLGSDI